MPSGSYQELFDRHPRYAGRGGLGSGAMGIVYRAYDTELGIEVALKTLHGSQDPDELYHLKQEFRVLAGLHHENLVQLYDLVVTDRGR